MNRRFTTIRSCLATAGMVILMALFAITEANAQLATATCSPNYQYGCMAFNHLVLNGSAYNGTGCLAASSGSGTNTNVTATALPGQTITWGSNSLGNYEYGGQYDGYMNIYIDWNNDGDFVDANEHPISWWYAYISASGSLTVPSNVTPGPKRVRFMFDYWYYADYYTGYYTDPCFSVVNNYSNYGASADMRLDIGYNNDAAITSVGTSTAAPFAAGTNDIVTKVTNNGLNTINNLTLNYTITPSTGSPINGTATYSTAIPSGQSANITLYANYPFPSIGSAKVTVTVNTVNGTTDGNAANNTGSALLGAGLNGTYTVGGSNPNFSSIKQAADQLSAGGTLGPVTFNIRPGTYTENVYIGPFPGNSNTKPVVFQSENQNANTCVLQFSGLTTPAGNTGDLLNTTSVGGTPTLRLNNADYVSFKYMTIASLNVGYNTAVELCGPANTVTATTQAYGGSDNVTFDNVIFNAQVNTGALASMNDVVFVSVNGSLNNNLTISSCTFNNGACQMYVNRNFFTIGGVFLSFPTTPPIAHAVPQLLNNNFNNYGAFPLRLDNTVDAVIRGNSWTSNNMTTQRGIMFTQHEGNFVFTKNRVTHPVASGVEALFFGTRTNNSVRGLVSNNYIRIPSGSGGWAVNNSSGLNMDYMHNTIYTLSSGTTNAAALNVTGSTGVTPVNNIFYNAAGGPAVNIVSGNVSGMNYNNLYTTGSVVGYWSGVGYANLAAWKPATGQDAASSSVAVNFANQALNDLALTLVDANLYGVGSTSNGTFNSGIRTRVPDDIFGTSRSRTEVYMGAFQLVPVITINPAPPASITGCANQTMTISANASVSYGAQLTFTWQRNGAPLLNGVNGVSGANTKDLVITNVQPSLNGGDYVLVVTGTGGADPVVTNIINVKIDAPIDIVRQPESRILCRNNETSVSVVANGTILGYQWQKDGVNIVGATGPVYVVKNADFAHSGRYRCVLSGTCGTTTVNTDDAVIYVASSTLIGRNPATKGAAVGSTGYLDVEVNATAQIPGYSPQFQWYKGATMLVDDGRITGATTNQLTIRNMATGDISQDYSCVVTGICGSQTSGKGGFYVSQIQIVTQPQNTETCSGTDASLLVTASSNIPGVQYNYVWRKGSTVINNDSKYSGATTNVLIVKGATATEAGDYTVEITANPTGANITSSTATLSILTSPAISTQPANVTVCEGDAASMNVAAGGGGLNYQWKVGGVDVPGATGATVSVPNVTSAMNGAKVTVVVSNNCGTVTSGEATLTVNSKPVITVQPETKAIHHTGDYVISVTATGGTEYQWKRNGSSIPGATQATYTIASGSSDKAGTYTCEVKNGCGSVETSGAVITVTSTEQEAVAAGYSLSAAQPMPVVSGGMVKATFRLPASAQAKVVLTDNYGREINTLFNGVATGETVLNIGTENLASGVYYYTLTSGKYSLTQRVVVIK